MKKLKKIADIPLFIYLLSIYPGLALLATNILQVEISVVVRPLIFSLIGAVSVNLFLVMVIKYKIKAALITTSIMGLFYSFGHIVRVAIESSNTDHKTFIEIFSYIATLTILIILAWLINRTRDGLESWESPLNTISVILILLPIIQISTSIFGNIFDQKYEDSRPSPVEESIVETKSQHPDIYYIILDGYSRADTLEELGFENSEFLNKLEETGFYIATCSTSNYRATALSMPAALNMNYLWDAVPNDGDQDTSVAQLYDALIHNRVRNELQQLGYTIISFQTGYKWDEWTDAHQYLVPTNKHTIEVQNTASITPFEYLYLRNTVLFSIMEGSRFATQRYIEHYNRVLFTLEELPNIALTPGPKFVYAHIMAPHHPFIFLPDGSLNPDSRFYNAEKGYPSVPELFIPGYLNNIQFLNSRLPDVIKKIIENSEAPPIIVIQGDHGFVIPERRFNILNAYYLPGQEDGILYPTISPVNTFRLIFNLYFDKKMNLLDDNMIRADIGKPYRQGRSKPFPESCP